MGFKRDKLLMSCGRETFQRNEAIPRGVAEDSSHPSAGCIGFTILGRWYQKEFMEVSWLFGETSKEVSQDLQLIIHQGQNGNLQGSGLC